MSSDSNERGCRPKSVCSAGTVGGAIEAPPTVLAVIGRGCRGPRSAAFSPRRLVGSVADAGGAAVMGTGIVSIGLALDQQPMLSRILLAIAGVLWLGLFGL